MTTTDIRPRRSPAAPTPHAGPTVRVARSCARHPWRALIVWIVFVAACLTVGGMVGLNDATAADEAHGESGRADTVLRHAGLATPAIEHVLVSRGSPAQRQSAAADAARRLQALPGVTSVDAPATSADGAAVIVTARMSGDSDTAEDRVDPLLAATAATQKAHTGVLVEEVGDASVAKGVDANVAKDLGHAGVLSLPVTLAILLIAFGALVVAGVPLLLGLSSVGAATGLSMIASHLVPDSGTTSSVILMIGMAVGVDYSLFYCKRVREEQANGAGKFDAIEAAARTSGHTVIVSGLAVIVSMAGLFLAGDVVFSSLALGSILVVAVAVLGSLTVVPAMLSLLGTRIDRLRVPLIWRITQRPGEPRVWPALLRPALRKPAATLAVSTGLMLAVAAPALTLHLKSSSASSLPRTIPVVQSLDRLTEHFPSTESSHDVVVTAGAADAGRVVSALTAVTHDPDIKASVDGRVHVASLRITDEATSAGAKRSLADLRTRALPQALKGISGASYAVSGETAQDADYDHHMASRLALIIGFVLALTMLVMVVTFRSAVIGLLTIGVNALSAAAAFGVLTLVFQRHWAEGLLGFHSSGTIASWVPLMLFVILCGLSMDYHVFVLSRVREADQQGHSPHDAVRLGITRSAGVVTSAALVMVSVFAIFASLSMVEMKELGVGLGVAVLLDAVVVRAVVLPSALALLGRRAWWPSKRSSRSGGR